MLPVVAMLLAAVTARAQDGSNAYSFLEIPTSSHVMALGGGGIALIDDDVALAQENPALIGAETDRQVALGYMRWFGSANFASVRFGNSAGERAGWAAGIRYLGYGDMTYTDADGTPGGTFSASDVVAEGTYSHDFTDRLRGGINLKMAYSHYEQYSAFAMGVDLGLSYYDDEKRLSLAVVMANAGGQLKRFNETHDRLPFDLKLGYMQGLGSTPFSLAITATHLTKWKLPYMSYNSQETEAAPEEKHGFASDLFRHLIFGLQYAPSERFYAAIGYNYKTRTDMASYSRSFLSGWSAGIGLNVKAFRIGVAYAQPHRGGTSLMLNVAMNIGELL
ncbi:MAG: type IX secretion system protein PorQ [Muribaculaceae bacterium]|nr:type IX secretion system protein PorQ [Muribaculaceae bacterium]